MEQHNTSNNTLHIKLDDNLNDSVAWEFSAASHGRDIGGIGGTCRRCLSKKLFECSEITAEICLNINVMHCSNPQNKITNV